MPAALWGGAALIVLLTATVLTVPEIRGLRRAPQAVVAIAEAAAVTPLP